MERPGGDSAAGGGAARARLGGRHEAAIPFDEVLAAARRREEWGLTILYRRLQPALLGFLRAQERRAADDLASEAWVGVVGALENFVGDEAAFRCWVFAIARRRLIDHRRKAWRRATDPVGDDPVIDLRTPQHVEDEALGSLSTRVALQRIAALPPAQAEVVLLRVLGGFDAAEVAAITGRRPGAVRVLQHRALRRLAREVGDLHVTD